MMSLIICPSCKNAYDDKEDKCPECYEPNEKDG